MALNLRNGNNATISIKEKSHDVNNGVKFMETPLTKDNLCASKGAIIPILLIKPKLIFNLNAKKLKFVAHE